MAQHQHYYQIIHQDQVIQTLSLEELQRFYPNICVESNTNVQYVINSQDENAGQFPSQQVLIADQQIVLNSGESNQPIIVDPSQINYQPQTQYNIEEMVTDYQQPEINNSQTQIYFTPPKPTQQIIPQSPPSQLISQIAQRQMVTQQVIQQTRTQNQHVNQQSPQPIRQMVSQQPQQVNNTHTMIGQRRMQQIAQNQPNRPIQQVTENISRQIPPNQSNIQRQIPQNSPNIIQRQVPQNSGTIQRQAQQSSANIPRQVPSSNTTNIQRHMQQNFVNISKTGQPTPPRIQYSSPQQNQQSQQTVMEMENDDNQHVLINDGRYMTLGQFKQEFGQNRQQNNNVHQNITSNQSTQVENSVKPKRAPRRNPNRGGRANRGGRGNQNNQLHNQNLQQSAQNIQTQQPPQNHVNVVTQKPFQQLNNTPPQKTFANKNPNPVKSAAVMQYQQRSMQSPHIQQQPQQPVIQQPVIQQPVIQQPVIQQPVIQQQQQVIQPHIQHQNIPTPVQHMAQLPSMQQQNIQPHIQQHSMQQPPLQPHIQQQIPQYQQPSQVQPLIPLSPHVTNGHLQNNTYSPPASQGQNQYLDDSSNLSDDYKDSARMLVCLENGEQRLITFTLPKESCTVQDLLEQVGVPFNADTKIECISNTGCEIDYIVNVGAVNNTMFAGADSQQQVLTVDTIAESQECIVSQSGAIIPLTEETKPPLPEEPPKSQSPEKSQDPPKEMPRFVEGYLAVCNHCGYLSEDFNRCQRCKTKLPDDIKSILNRPDANEKKDSKIKVNVPKLTPKPLTPNNSKPNVPQKVAKIKKTKTPDTEPVVLTLSSDDEESTPKMPNASQIANKAMDAITLAVLKKEPVITMGCDVKIDEEMIERGILGCTNEALQKSGTINTTLHCRTVRIGSYRFIPKEDVLISSIGLHIYVPTLGTSSVITQIFVPTECIVKVLASFNKALPVLFFYVTPSMSTYVRNVLKMKEGSDIYFDPLSSEEPHKRITFLPENIPEDTRNKTKQIYHTTKEYSIIEEITAKEANEILIRTCPKEVTSLKPQIQPVITNEVRHLLIYPPGKGGIAIGHDDYLCLAQDQFLNDVIIDFYLKYLMTEMLAPPIQEKVYIFSSFFYKRLTTKPAKALRRTNQYELDPNLTPSEKRHCRVKKWTKNVNIFEKDYVIIPINENSHWFLAIICFPGLEGCRSMYDSNKILKEPVKEKKKLNTSITIGNTTITTVKASEDKKQIGKPIKCDDEEVSDRDEAEGDESELEESDVDTENIEEKKNNTPEPVKQPCILIFDSLSGASRSRVVATLRDYLTCEHRTKLKSNKTFTKDNIKGACPKVPQQMNFTDCGLYVLQYVESFFKDPITDYRIPIKQLKNWFEEIIVTRKREEISNLIRQLMAHNQKSVDVLPDIIFPTLNGELVTNTDPNYTDNEEADEEEEEEMDGEEEDEEEEQLEKDDQDSPKSHNSLQKLQAYNSESSSESSQNVASTTSTFVVTSADVSSSLKSESDDNKKSNKDTMSYLKSKRISRHKHSDMHDSKKVKLDE